MRVARAAYAKQQVDRTNVREANYRSLVGFFSEDILKSLFGHEWGETSASLVESQYRRRG